MPVDLSTVADDPSRWERPGYPALRQAAITPGEVLDISTRGLYIGTGGTLAVVDHHGQEVTYVNVANGSALPIAIKEVKATGTTATNIVGWF